VRKPSRQTAGMTGEHVMKLRVTVVVVVTAAAAYSWAAERELPHEAGRWQELAPMPTPRHDLEAVSWGGKIYAISGAGDLTTDAVEVYDPKTDTWSACAPIPEKRGWFGCALLGSKVYCMGGKRVRTQQEKEDSGDKNHYELRSSMNIYDLVHDRWSEGPPLSAPRAGLKAVAAGGRIYAIAGNGREEGVRVEVFDPATNTWSPGVPLPHARTAPAAAAVGGKIYVAGGWGSGDERSDLFIYDTAAGKWTTGAPMPTARRDHAAAVLGSRIYFLGGVSHGKYTNAVEIYDTTTNTWSTATPLPEKKAWMGACVLDGRIYVVGGANRNEQEKRYNWIDDLHVYIPPKETTDGK